MKKQKLFACLLAAGMVMSAESQVMAGNFTGELGNEATFETLLEAHENAPLSLIHI